MSYLAIILPYVSKVLSCKIRFLSLSFKLLLLSYDFLQLLLAFGLVAMTSLKKFTIYSFCASSLWMILRNWANSTLPVFFSSIASIKCLISYLEVTRPTDRRSSSSWSMLIHPFLSLSSALKYCFMRTR